MIGETVDAGLGDVTDGADILANDLAETNPCGFGSVRGPDPDFNGLVDLNSDMTITAVDSCDNCFFGLDLDSGFVVEQGAESLDLTPATDSNATGTAHTVTAHVEDTAGDPVAGVTVEFDVTGGQPDLLVGHHRRERQRHVHVHRRDRRRGHDRGVRRRGRRRHGGSERAR